MMAIARGLDAAAVVSASLLLPAADGVIPAGQRVKGDAAATAAASERIIYNPEGGADELGDIVDRAPRQERQARPIDDDARAVALKDNVVARRASSRLVLEGEGVLEAVAAAGLDGDAQHLAGSVAATAAEAVCGRELAQPLRSPVSGAAGWRRGPYLR